MVVLEGSAGERAEARAHWQGQGYGVLTPDLMIGIAGHRPENALHLSATATELATARTLAGRAWPLEELAARYRHFNEMFAPTEEALQSRGPPGDLDSLATRILLIHEYRRIVLRDPVLPVPLRPDDWPGRKAHDLAAGIYAAIADVSDRWLSRHAVDEQGPLSPPAQPMSGRFAGRLT
jgi:phenylacetic acid degradation operon negative regulatory protein